jgi:hypothetical protein
MRTILSASLSVLALVGFSPLAGNDDADGSAENQPGSNGDVMKNFTRHRPGDCPEGPALQGRRLIGVRLPGCVVPEV